ncbi:Transcription factor, Myb superfamily [Handroanthus impetiginosus]|uniref:Transcription factor, Myb superfamily n=1 Tax=Handroanthus impetiginosus TaxID=429701 RepID=A0A2G9GFM6_9LAMI|nr:Transcription factor, Myb superfamily [Handroanthus impetiginosus]
MKKSKDGNNGEVPNKKERHIVSWSQEEDDILREQIRIHGTENWTIIASKFKDKTTRQCRRRWFTYLNSDFKKGGWSPEEDMLLCEAQKIYGNRWTEIAKVVSGRTDNAVKNRFTTLCKKRAKCEALAKENSTTSYINLNNKRVIFRNGLNMDGGSESSGPLKKLRTYVSDTIENCNQGENLAGDFGVAHHLRRHPFAVSQLHVKNMKEASTDGSTNTNDKIQRTFLKKDDPKVHALMQQAELLSSLAIKVNTEKTNQSLENAWMVLQDFLKQNKESDQLPVGNSDMNFEVEKFRELVEDLRSFNEGSPSSRREGDVYESSPASSEYSTASTLLSNVPCDKTEECEADICVLHQETGQEFQSDLLDNQQSFVEENGICHTASTNEAKNILASDEIKADDGALCGYSDMAFSSPLHVTPLFRTLAAAIPSPKFSESEKHFLMKTLGMESATSPSSIINPPQTPSCKRSLLHCL